MKLTLADSRYLKDSISIISDLVTEASFKITTDGIELIAMDPANVAMVIYKLLSSTFTEYEVSEPVTIAINLTNFKQFLKRAKPDDVLTLEIEKSKLLMTLKGRSTRKFSLPILDLEEKEQKVPELTFAAKISMPSSQFNESIEDADIVADALTLISEKSKFTINAEGDLSKARIEFSADEDIIIKSDASTTIKSKYSIEYLKKMIGGSKLSDKVEIHFNTDYPLKLEYRVVDRVQIAFILAPRVEND